MSSPPGGKGKCTCHKENKEAERAAEEAPKIIKDILRDLASGKLECPPAFKEPDQSLLEYGYETTLLKYKWFSGMDIPFLGPSTKVMPYYTHLFMSYLLGNVTHLIQHLSKMKPAELRLIMKRQEGYLQIGPISAVIIGAKIFHGYADQDVLRRITGRSIERRHLEVLQKLIDMGAQVKNHDLAGYTPLHHCTTSRPAKGQDYLLKIMEMLLVNGADINAVNRFGETPLHQCFGPAEDNLAKAKLLARYNANPYLKDIFGNCPMEEASRSCPEIHAVLREAEIRVILDERRVAKARKLKSCQKCGCQAERRCTGCFLYWYCESKCQKSDWPAHEETCLKIRKEYQPVHPCHLTVVEMTVQNGKPVDFTPRKLYKDKTPKSKHFLLKVTLNANKDLGEVPVKFSKNEQLMYCQNRAKDVQYHLRADTAIGRQLEKAILAAGSRPYGFFYSVIREDAKHYINPNLQPPEVW
eukprot:TRINITY_DN30264_c0_g1_i2.p1 TRINITY_DN30264_c0_g1~~TRINITY_DN30264_c0_g1_i2.p1  ORF type:complete len:469 (-),score=103.90 TRINITY_DN30264_c0_g1_i2:240-1646(-)